MPDPILRPSDVENLAGTDTGREHLSHSKLNKFLACHELYANHYERRLERIDKRESLEMGKAYQKAIELQDPDAAPLVLDGWEMCGVCDGEGFTELREKQPLQEIVVSTGSGPVRVGAGEPVPCEACAGTGRTPPDEEPYFHTQEAQDKHEINKAVVRAAAALYLRKWPAPVGEHREFEFLVRLRNPWTGHYSRTFDLKGYADGLQGLEPALNIGGVDIYTSTEVPREQFVPVQDVRQIPLELVENKLVGRVDSVMVQRLPLDRQLQLLRYGVWRATGRTVGTVHFRWVKKPSIKPRQKESIPEFCERLAADYEERPDFYAYEPPPSYITSADLLKIECELWTWAQQLRDLRRQRIFDRNTSHCSDYGGCDFIPLCSGDPDADHLYRIRPERTE
jgi:hypothetical protein